MFREEMSSAVGVKLKELFFRVHNFIQETPYDKKLEHKCSAKPFHNLRKVLAKMAN